MIRSPPLRFVACILLAWIGARLWMLSTEAEVEPLGAVADLSTAGAIHGNRAIRYPRARDAFDPDAAPQTASAQASQAAHPLRARIAPAPVPGTTLSPGDAQISRLIAEARGGSPLMALLALAGSRAGRSPVPLLRTPENRDRPRARRFGGYGWIFAREGGARGLGEAGQLGGGQMGMRIDYALGRDLAVGARIATPLSGAGAEMAVGIAIKPIAGNGFALSVERRIALDRGGRDAFAVMAAGGIGPVDLPASFSLEAYAQSGVVGARSRDGFVDGAATITRPISAGEGPALRAGGGLWGAAQPGLSRLDMGPRIKLGIARSPVHLGAAIDWRHRIAGNAAPRSGLSLTLDGSF